MRNVLNFLIRYNSWFLLAVYVAVSCVLLVDGNDFQQSVYLTSANSVTASLNGARSSLTGYWGLRETNDRLERTNAALKAEVLELRHQLQTTREQLPDTTLPPPRERRFNYIVASVLGNTVTNARNFITINKGYRQGVRPGMGVINSLGLVGIVNVCGPNTSRVISVLNMSQRFSVKLAGTDYVGSLTWRPGNPGEAYMVEVPRHARFFRDQQVVTSGYSTSFPEGIPVGSVQASVKRAGDNYLTLKLKLANDFPRLSTVWIITDTFKPELDSLATIDLNAKPPQP